MRTPQLTDDHRVRNLLYMTLSVLDSREAHCMLTANT
jgi:hypothetical protein